MRLPTAARFARVWAGHESTRDCVVEDTPGGSNSLGRLMRQFSSDDDDELPAIVVVFYSRLGWTPLVQRVLSGAGVWMVQL